MSNLIKSEIPYHTGTHRVEEMQRQKGPRGTVAQVEEILYRCAAPWRGMTVLSEPKVSGLSFGQSFYLDKQPLAQEVPKRLHFHILGRYALTHSRSGSKVNHCNSF